MRVERRLARVGAVVGGVLLVAPGRRDAERPVEGAPVRGLQTKLERHGQELAQVLVRDLAYRVCVCLGRLDAQQNRASSNERPDRSERASEGVGE